MSISKSTIIDYASSDGSYHTNSISAYYNQNSYTETLTELIANETASLYEKMVNDFANQTMTNAAAGSSAKLLHSLNPDFENFLNKEVALKPESKSI